MRKIILIIATALAAMLAHAQQGWTLQQCVDSALVHNWNVKQYNLRSKTSEINYQQAKKRSATVFKRFGRFQPRFREHKSFAGRSQQPQYGTICLRKLNFETGKPWAGCRPYALLGPSHQTQHRSAECRFAGIVCREETSGR